MAENKVEDGIPSRGAGGLHQDEGGAVQNDDFEESGSTGGAASGSFNITFGPGSVVLNRTAISPEDIAREIVKPLSRQLRKLGYFSS